MRILNEKSDISSQAIYPEKRRYFNLYFMGTDGDFSLFQQCMDKYIPFDWPINCFVWQSEGVSAEIVSFNRTAASICNAAVYWSNNDYEFGHEFRKEIWAAQMGRLVSSNKKFFGGSSNLLCAVPYISNILGNKNWYESMYDMCVDLSKVIKDELIEVVTIKSAIQVTVGTRM